MSEQEFLTTFFWYTGILTLLLFIAIIRLMIAIRKEDKEISKCVTKKNEQHFNGPVWTYWPSLRLKKKK